MDRVYDNMTLFAKWTAHDYTLSYDTQGSAATANGTATFDSNYGTLPTPTKTGYDFDKWWDAAMGGTEITATTKVTKADNHTICAHWKPKTYVVTYDVNTGNALSPNTQTKQYDKTYGVAADGTTADPMPTPTKTGYAFDGWFTLVTDGVKVVNTNPVKLTAAQTLFAHWTAKQFEVTLDYQEIETVNTDFQATYDQKYNGLPASPTRTGYDFKGWFTETTGGTEIKPTDTVAITADSTFRARWDPHKWTVTYNYQDKGVTANTDRTTTYGGAYELLTAPARTGYTPKGWFDAATSGNEVTAETKVKTDANHNLFLQWSPNKYTVTMKYNYGLKPDSSFEATYDEEYGASVFQQVREGYDFKGWFDAATSGNLIVSTTKYVTAANQSLYARWEAHTINVTFDPGEGATVAPTTQTKQYDSTYSKNQTGTADELMPEPIHAGYEFDGWFTAKTDGDEVENTDTVNVIENTTLFAHWTALTYEITFDPNGEGAVVNPTKQTQQYDRTYGVDVTGAVAVMPTPTRYGYKFDGWFTGKTDGTNTRTKGTGKYEYQNPVKVNDKGEVEIPFKHASSYLLTETMILTDIENHWACSSIMSMANSDVVSGNGAGLFEPDKTITRAEFAKMIATAYGYKEASNVAQFDDVKSTDWYSNAVYALNQYGIMTGYDNSRFGADDGLTREQMATIIYRVLKNGNYKFTTADVPKYSDESKIAPYANEAVRALTSMGVLKGTNQNNFSPNYFATKAQVAVILVE